MKNKFIKTMDKRWPFGYNIEIYTKIETLQAMKKNHMRRSLQRRGKGENLDESKICPALELEQSRLGPLSPLEIFSRLGATG